MKIGIVGGTGNISESIVRLALEEGHEVVCVNRGQSGAVQDGARLLRVDRRDRGRFEELMRAEKFDAAIDMICFTAEDAASSIRAFRDVGVFVQTSTVCTYGIDYDWFPTTEDHPLRPITGYARDKAAADALYMEAYDKEGFPVVIIKPSTTYGPQQGLIRQVAWDFSWIDRIRQGLPIIVCGDGNALHQFLHVDDAAKAFVGVLDKARCIGQAYNLVKREYSTWAGYHRTAMQVIGREVELVGVPFTTLQRFDIPDFDICEEIFAYHVYYSAEKIFRDVPEFQPTISLAEGIEQVLAAMDADGRIPAAERSGWEDEIISAQRRVAP
ncbi:MAG: NAD-dependent epimerase/dehydratase family protein [Candidatus Promineifilaceae bacterium]|nr:NAD-dependent epimerase/dehydratase family protein [Candidatus Promineifilaceae bacterium]